MTGALSVVNFVMMSQNKFRYISLQFYAFQFQIKESSFFLSLYTALPPREDYVQVDCVLKPRYKKCTEKEKIKMIGLKRMYKKN